MGSYQSITLFEQDYLQCWEEEPCNLIYRVGWIEEMILRSNMDIVFLEVNSYLSFHSRYPENRVEELRLKLHKNIQTIEDKLFIITFLGEGVRYELILPLIEDLKNLGVRDIRLLYTTVNHTPIDIPYVTYFEQYARVPIIHPTERNPIKQIDKPFLCLVRNIKEERLWFLESLSKFDWWEDKNIIDLSFGTGMSTVDNYDFRFSKDLMDRIPIVYDYQDVTDDIQHQDIGSVNQMVNVVVETFITNMDEFKTTRLNCIQSQGYFTEKSMKPFYYNQIPLFVSQTGTVDIIRSLGFDVFDDLMEGHFYDKIWDTKERIHQVTLLMDRFISGGINYNEFYQTHRERFSQNHKLLLEWDSKSYEVGAQKLRDLIFHKVDS